MNAPRYHRQADLIQRLNEMFAAEGLTLCTLAHHHGVPELGSHFWLRSGTTEIVDADICVEELAAQFGLVAHGDVVGA